MLERGVRGTVVETAGIAGAVAADAPGDWRAGKSLAAVCQSVQPSRQTSESLLTRPSEIHFRMMSPRAGPYWPPVGGRTYQIAVGAAAIGALAVGVVAVAGPAETAGAEGAAATDPTAGLLAATTAP